MLTGAHTLSHSPVMMNDAILVYHPYPALHALVPARVYERVDAVAVRSRQVHVTHGALKRAPGLRKT